MQENHTQQSGIRINLFISTPHAILIGSVVISLAILINGGAIRFKDSTTRSANTTQAAQQLPSQPNQQAPQAAAPENTGPIKVSLDDDPVLGDKNAPITLIDFSDYECPFCKRHFDQTFAQIKKDYIDSGKVKYVYRDLPLPFHDPMATKEAIAANCAREQGNDTAYFKYHHEIFKRTKSNGNGLAVDDLYTIASDLALNSGNFKSCLDSEKYKDEVQKDLADASKYGATGTPTFFIGKSTGSEIEGTMLVGAQPYGAFKTIIDQQLN